MKRMACSFLDAVSCAIVGDNAKEPKRANVRRGKKTRFTADVEVRASPGGECAHEPIKGGCSDEAAPIKWIGGRAWSPGVYRALRALGKPLDVAWEKAFIRPLTFNNYSPITKLYSGN